jgi:hypothetical protein
MIPEVRKKFNASFTPEKYNQLKDCITAKYGCKPSFREAETPFFIPEILKNRLLEACSELSEIIGRPDLKELTQGALYDPSVIVPNEDTHTTFLQMDFGITLDENGDPFPQLIEIQGFPSVYFFQYMVTQAYKEVYDIPEEMTSYFNGLTAENYVALMRDIIVGESDPKHVVLLEIEPEKQTTYIDMLSTSVELGIPVVCVTKVLKKGKKLYYVNKEGAETLIEKIYNRVVFDELHHRSDLNMSFHFTDDLDVKWVGHPNWFYRISKYVMPLLKSRYVPETHYLDKIDKLPEDLQDWVLKPLFSFAGAGVIIDVNKEVVDTISEPSQYILQRKVQYEPVIVSPDDPVKVEVRMLMLWPDDADAPFVVTNLARLSKGKMIGVKYNKDKDWVGGSVGLFYE